MTRAELRKLAGDNALLAPQFVGVVPECTVPAADLLELVELVELVTSCP